MTTPPDQQITSAQPGLRSLILLTGLTLIGMAIRLFYAWQPLPGLLEQGMADDAFYYLTIARNIAGGLGVSFDSITPTNGFHPLYALILVPVFKIFLDSPELAAKLALSVLMVINALTALLLYQTVRQVSITAGGIFAAILWLFNPWVLIIALGGVESAVYIFCAALTIFLYLQCIATTGQTHRFRWTIALGVSAAVTVLARSDGIFLISAILLEGAVFTLRTRSHSGRGELARQALTFLAASGMVLVPWLLWNQLTFGYPTQVSGMAVHWQTHYDVIGGAAKAAKLLQSTLRMAYGSLFFSIQAVVVGVLWLAVKLITGRRHETQGNQPSLSGLEARLVWVVCIYAIQTILFYAVYLWQEQFWYFMPLLYIMALIGGLLFAKIVAITRGLTQGFQRFAQGMAITIVLLLGVIFWWGWQGGWLKIYPAQRNALFIAEMLSTQTEAGARVGAWNSGILGYLSGRAVINLDGVVNNTLYDYVRQRDVSFFDLCGVWDYIQSTEIDYLTDYENAWGEDLEVIFKRRLSLWAEFPSLPDSGSYPIKIYKVLDNPEPPLSASCPEALNLHK